MSVFLVLEMIIKTKPKNITPIWTHLNEFFVCLVGFFLGVGRWSVHVQESCLNSLKKINLKQKKYGEM